MTCNDKSREYQIGECAKPDIHTINFLGKRKRIRKSDKLKNAESRENVVKPVICKDEPTAQKKQELCQSSHRLDNGIRKTDGHRNVT